MLRPPSQKKDLSGTVLNAPLSQKPSLSRIISPSEIAKSSLSGTLSPSLSGIPPLIEITEMHTVGML